MTEQADRVWDLPTRAFHWLLVALVALQYASGEFGFPSMRWHYLGGYATLALVLFRVLWGFFGSQTSRFGDFVRGPRAVLAYLAGLGRAEAPRRAGHNPLGGWSVVAMLASIAVQATTGLFASDDISEEGPLVARVSAATVDLMTRVHAWNRYVLLALVVVHLGAIAAYALRGTNLVAPMWSGRARDVDARALRFATPWLALMLAVLAAAVVWALVAWGEAG
ncbi:cytochrome b/b6 domain-containing protein [Dokdonella fugitiva]|jgi:cytochrome b|uniref:Cytochrome b n=1 Tax=Dokdonella fugitiva TaxID=328517 RepID=A0A4R2I4N1_9GAMM|nr:cytochrome b/b6 domain-containing protein [Dokdonella fugitiva]MBA8884199.1 cytochrome b [Dokdonella fugitiva]TCO38887.1 cytochrome b [Dokdonella fugitiva]